MADLPIGTSTDKTLNPAVKSNFPDWLLKN